MRRRRRQPREIVFSFDSFLDLVANVVGIILRLILVVWVGARSYTFIVPTEEKPAPPAPSIKSSDLEKEVQQWTSQAVEKEGALARLDAKLNETNTRLQSVRADEQQLKNAPMDHNGMLAALQEKRQGLEEEQATLLNDRKAILGARENEAKLNELKEKQIAMSTRLEKMQETSKKKKVLRYQVPVADVIQTEELQFECRAGRVTFLDVAALMAEVKKGLYGSVDQLRDQWSVEKRTEPIGGFRLRYTIARQQTLTDKLVGKATPDAGANFNYGLEKWVAEPLKVNRGETVKKAMAAGSEFRDIVDNLDPKVTAVTFWVYPDSFDLYRDLRDFLIKKSILVAGRPLPIGVPIASSRNGTASRGQ